MNEKQLEILTRPSKIKVDDLENKSDRTLMYGSFSMADGILGYHLYLETEMFHFTVYLVKSKQDYELNTGKPLKSFKYRDEITTEQFLRDILDFHPECCDYEFCSLLKSKGIDIDFFTEFDKDRPNKKYYGIKYEELKRIKKNG